MTQEQPWWWTMWATREIDGEDYNVADTLEKIVAEASRRAELKAWEEARDLINRDLEATKRLREWESRIHNEYVYGLFQAYRLLDSRVRALSRS